MTKMSDREIVMAYISTLPDTKMKEVYQILTERYEIHKRKFMLFNREGVEARAPNGKIRLRPYQYERILGTYGEQGFHRLVEILYDYITYLEENTECVRDGRRKLKDLSVISHYHILTKGWVAQRYEQENPQYSIILDEDTEKLVDFFEIESKAQAIKYIQQTPKELRYDNQEIIYLTSKYDIKPEEV